MSKEDEYWLEFTVYVPSLFAGSLIPLCGLCANTGWINTLNSSKTASGFRCGCRRPCICPNGRAIKKRQK